MRYSGYNRLLILCPTYGRRTLLRNSLACFLAQRYPKDCATMLIYDDAGQYPYAEVPIFQEYVNELKGTDKSVLIGNVWLASHKKRCNHLSHKYNIMLQMAETMEIKYDIAVVWDDDDIYLPYHLYYINHAAQAYPHAVGWQQQMVLSLYTGQPELEKSDGRFHGCLAAQREFLVNTGGWPQTKHETFDQQMIAKVKPAKYITPDPTYCFRWNSTAAPHVQHYMGGPDPEAWWAKYPLVEQGMFSDLMPEMDAETKRIYAQFPTVPN